MKIYTILDIANYLIDSDYSLFENDNYYLYYNPDTGLNYNGNTDPDNITITVTLSDYGIDINNYDCLSDFENIDNPEFLTICEKLLDDLCEIL